MLATFIMTGTCHCNYWYKTSNSSSSCTIQGWCNVRIIWSLLLCIMACFDNTMTTTTLAVVSGHSSSTTTNSPNNHINDIERIVQEFLTISPEQVPSWEELDRRPLPNWYDDAKFGIFIHWGLFSVPSYGSEWFWYDWKSYPIPNQYDTFVTRTEIPNFNYPDYSHRFHAELFRPQEWVQLIQQSGAQYVVVTSKHHDGFCMWDSTNVTSTWNWNVMDIGPHRDLLGDLIRELRRTPSDRTYDDVTDINCSNGGGGTRNPYTNQSIRLGLYHSLYEWYNPMYMNDKRNNFTTQQFVTQKTVPELIDLILQYQPDLIWSDGDWETTSTYWLARQFLSWYVSYNNSNSSHVTNDVVYNDRWGEDVLCHHGSFLTCADRYNPTQLQQHKYENAFTIDKSSWGYNRNSSTHIDSYMTTKEIIHTMIQTIAYNGNVLINIGPNADGTIDPIFVDRLNNIGKWLSVNGEAIYSTRPWMKCQSEVNDDNTTTIFYTTKQQREIVTDDAITIYALFTQWPTDNLLSLPCVTPTNMTEIYFLGLQKEVDILATSIPFKPMKNRVKEDDVQYVDASNRRATIGQQTNTKRRTESTTTTSTRPGSADNNGIEVVLPALTPDIIPCDHAWVVVLTGIE